MPNVVHLLSHTTPDCRAGKIVLMWAGLRKMTMVDDENLRPYHSYLKAMEDRARMSRINRTRRRMLMFGAILMLLVLAYWLFKASYM